MGGLLSFLGGSAFRMVWGEVAAWFTAKQEHRHELDRLELQERVDSAMHARNLEAMRVQAELGIKTIEVQRDADISRLEVDAWADMSRATAKKTGIFFVDVWNGVIRPLLATLAILFIVFEVIAAGFVLSEYTKELFAVILGLYVADRNLAKRGK
jgi:hypothetical protein